MSIDPKKFGLSPSLLETVKEALKGNQHKIDVAEPKGKITGADFKKLRGEDAKPDFLDLDKDGNKKDLMKQAAKQVKEEVDFDEAAVTGNEGHGYHGNVQAKDDAERAKKYSAMHGKVKKLVGAAGHLKDAKTPNKMVKHFLDSPHGRHVADDPSDKNITSRFGHFKKSYKPHMHEEVQIAETDDAVAKQLAAKKEAMKTQIQRKIAQKQMSTMQAKANKRLSSINSSNDKCSCGSTNESKMKCEVHGDKAKGTKGGKEPIEVNPPLREASDLPKSVVKKGHEIAKSLIKHRSKVKEPYAVGMATAKKSANIKD